MVLFISFPDIFIICKDVQHMRNEGVLLPTEQNTVLLSANSRGSGVEDGGGSCGKECQEAIQFQSIIPVFYVYLVLSQVDVIMHEGLFLYYRRKQGV